MSKRASPATTSGSSRNRWRRLLIALEQLDPSTQPARHYGRYPQAAGRRLPARAPVNLHLAQAKCRLFSWCRPGGDLSGIWR